MIDMDANGFVGKAVVTTWLRGNESAEGHKSVHLRLDEKFTTENRGNLYERVELQICLNSIDDVQKLKQFATIIAENFMQHPRPAKPIPAQEPLKPSDCYERPEPGKVLLQLDPVELEMIQMMMADYIAQLTYNIPTLSALPPDTPVFPEPLIIRTNVMAHNIAINLDRKIAMKKHDLAWPDLSFRPRQPVKQPEEKSESESSAKKVNGGSPLAKPKNQQADQVEETLSEKPESIAVTVNH